LPYLSFFDINKDGLGGQFIAKFHLAWGSSASCGIASINAWAHNIIHDPAFANLKAFVRWCRKNRYVNGEIEIRELKEDKRPVKSLSNTQIKKLLSTSKPYKTLWMRILLALGTGLRLGDIETWRISDIDFENSYVTTRSKKTRKSMGSRPVPVPIMAELKKYVSKLDTGQEKVFNDNFSRYRWDKIREKLGLDDFKFHDLRKTFGSVLAQKGVSTAVTQKLLEHSSPDLTNKMYTNVDPVLRHAVDQIPASDWL